MKLSEYSSTRCLEESTLSICKRNESNKVGRKEAANVFNSGVVCLAYLQMCCMYPGHLCPHLRHGCPISMCSVGVLCRINSHAC